MAASGRCAVGFLCSSVKRSEFFVVIAALLEGAFNGLGCEKLHSPSDVSGDKTKREYDGSNA
jgi:hypothetical protein